MYLLSKDFLKWSERKETSFSDLLRFNVIFFWIKATYFMIYISSFTRTLGLSHAYRHLHEAGCSWPPSSWPTPKSWWSVRSISRLFRKEPAGARSFEIHHFAAKIWGEPPRKDFRALESSISPLFNERDPWTGATYSRFTQLSEISIRPGPFDPRNLADPPDRA